MAWGERAKTWGELQDTVRKITRGWKFRIDTLQIKQNKHEKQIPNIQKTEKNRGK